MSSAQRTGSPVQQVSETQGSKEWHEARLGNVTASRLADVFAGRQTKRRKQYISQLAYERAGLGLWSTDDPPWFAHGRQYEHLARLTYSMLVGEYVSVVGALRGPGGLIASPDGLVNDDGGIEIKSYKSQVEYTKATRRVPSLYVPQVMGNLYVTGRAWWDFVAYQIHTREIAVHRVTPDPLFFDRIRREVYLINREINRKAGIKSWPLSSH